MSNLVSYNIHSNVVELRYANGHQGFAYLNKYSGKVVYRMKIDTLSEIKHTGIYLGQDASGVNYYMHNHYLIGRPNIVTEWEFSQEKRILPYPEPCANQPITVVHNALQAIIRSEKYDKVTYNCQTFTSEASNNVRHSPDVEKWKGYAFLGALVIAVVAISKS